MSNIVAFDTVVIKAFLNHVVLIYDQLLSFEPINWISSALIIIFLPTASFSRLCSWFSDRHGE